MAKGSKKPSITSFFEPAVIDETKRIAREVLSSMMPELLKVCVTGNLQRYDRHSDKHPVNFELACIWDAGEVPSVYTNRIVDRLCTPLTPAILEALLQDMRQYCEEDEGSDSELSKEIDVQFGSTSWNISNNELGYRKHLDCKREKGANGTRHPDSRNAKRRTVVRSFIEAQTKHIDRYREAEKVHKPFAMALCEVGYSRAPINRLREHARHQSSNYCMMILL